MKVLIVHAHENPDSFCSALFNVAKNDLSSKGHQVITTDLYQQNFKAVASKQDFTALDHDRYYKYATAQLEASETNSYTPDLIEEMQKIDNIDVLNFNFPLWWFGMPAILKGWVDRVLAFGVAYGGNYGMYEAGRFHGKKAFLTITTGSPETAYQPKGMNKRNIDRIVDSIHAGIFELLGFEVIDPFVAFGVSRITQDERSVVIERYKAFLDKV